MKQKTVTKSPTAVLLAVLALVLTVGAGAALADQSEVIVHRVHQDDCEGADCGQMIFIGEDGERVELNGDGHAWISAFSDGLRSVHPGHGRGFLGVQLTDLTLELREHFGIPREAGVMIGKIIADSPAEAAGLAVGDVIVSVDQETVRSAGHLASLIRAADADAVVTLEIWRDGGFSNFPVTLAQREMRGIPMMDGKHQKRVEIRCDDGDCPDLEGLDCGSDECEVRVQCTDSGCDCSVNGEAVDCSEIPGFAERHRE